MDNMSVTNAAVWAHQLWHNFLPLTTGLHLHCIAGSILHLVT